MKPKAFQCSLITLDTVGALARDLARRIIESGYRADVIVAISRGGFVPARLLCDLLHITDMTSIKIEHYGPGARAHAHTRLKYPLSGDFKGKRILLVDDVNDTGDTLEVATRHIQTFAPEALHTAVLHEKEHSVFKTHYCARHIREWRWIIYPWAVIEDIGGFIKAMDPPPEDSAQVIARLASEYGLEISQAQYAALHEFF